MTSPNWTAAKKQGRAYTALEATQRGVFLQGLLKDILAGYGTPEAQARVDAIMAEFAELATVDQVRQSAVRPGVPVQFKHPFGCDAYVRKFGVPTPASKKGKKNDV